MLGLTELSWDLIILFVVLSFILLLSLRTSRKPAQLVLVALCLIGYLIFLYFFAGFPRARPSFSAGSDVTLAWLLASIFACVVLGTISEYFFGLGEAPFSWRKMLTPMCVSPLVMLPLIGSLPNVDQISALQWVSFGFLGFQNGFFWRRIFEKISV